MARYVTPQNDGYAKTPRHPNGVWLRAMSSLYSGDRFDALWEQACEHVRDEWRAHQPPRHHRPRVLHLDERRR